MQLAISTGSCFPFLNSRLKQIGLIASFSQEIDGIEIIFARPCDFMRFKFGKKSTRLLQQFKFVNLHYPFGKHVHLSSVAEEKMIKKIKQLHKRICLKHVIVHPNAVKNWRNFQKSEFSFLFENQEAATNGQWQSAVAMKKLLHEKGFFMCLDLNHALSCGIKPKNFLFLKKKIKQVHVNATEAFGKKAEHKFLIESSQKTLKMIKPVLRQLRNAIWVIEPISLNNPRKKMLKEIALLKRI